MKCPKCKTVMDRVKAEEGEVYYYSCRKCGYSIGKPKTEEEPKETVSTTTVKEDAEAVETKDPSEVKQ